MILNRDRFAILSDIWGRFRSLSLISPIEPTVGPGDDGFLWIDIGVDGTPDNPLWKMWDEHAATWRLIGGGAGVVGWDDVTSKPATFPPETHTHSKLVASDGDPDPALSADDDGNLLTAGHISLPSMKQLRVLSAGSIQRGEVELYLLEGESAYGIQVDSANRVALCIGGAAELIANPNGVKLKSGASITEFSTDATFGDNSDAAVPTEKAVKTYVTTLDSAKVSKLAASDGDPADAVSTDNSGNVTGKGNNSLVDGKDFYPNADGRGLAARFINPTGLTIWTSHFRNAPVAPATLPPELAADYAWVNEAGIFASAPSTLTYDYAGEYLRCANGGTATRHFLARAITNAAANWQNMTIVARVFPSRSGNIGLRVDTGTGDGAAGEAYCEVYAIDTGANSYTVQTRYRENGGAVTTQITNIAQTVNVPIILYLTCSYNAGTGVYALYTYYRNEGPGDGYYIGGTPLAAGRVPQSGRAGIIYNAITGSSGYAAYCDWFYNQFT